MLLSLINNTIRPKRFNFNSDDNFREYKDIRNEVIDRYSNNIIGSDNNHNLAGGGGNDILDSVDGRDGLYSDNDYSNPRIISPDDGRRRGNDIIFGGKENGMT